MFGFPFIGIVDRRRKTTSMASKRPYVIYTAFAARNKFCNVGKEAKCDSFKPAEESWQPAVAANSKSSYNK